MTPGIQVVPHGTISGGAKLHLIRTSHSVAYLESKFHHSSITLLPEM